MLNNLKCDFNRYSNFHSPGTKLSVWGKILVLIKSPSFFAIAIHRFGFWVDAHYKYDKNQLIKYTLKFFYRLGVFLSIIFLKIEISEASDIGPGLYLSNKGYIILGTKKMDKFCTIQHKVTIGMGLEHKSPVIGSHVWIGSNSIIFGNIKIGEGTVIKENTVLSKSIPAKCLINGNPGRIIKRDIEMGFLPCESTSLKN